MKIQITNSADPHFGQILNLIEEIDEIGITGAIVETPEKQKWFYGADEFKKLIITIEHKTIKHETTHPHNYRNR